MKLTFEALRATRRPGLRPRSGYADFRCTHWYWGRFSLSNSLSPANSHWRNCSTFMDHSVMERYAVSPCPRLPHNASSAFIHLSLKLKEKGKRSVSFSCADNIMLEQISCGARSPACEIWTRFFHHVINTDYRQWEHYLRWCNEWIVLNRYGPK